MSERFDLKEDGISFKVKVVANSDSFEICGFNDWTNRLKVKLKSQPVKGKANKELLDEFEKMLNSEVRIVKGKRSNRKEIYVICKDKTEVMDRLNSF